MIIHDVEQNSPEWKKLREGMPTASMFSSILTPAQLKPAKSDYAEFLASQVLCGYDCDEWLGNIDTYHGKEAEQDAVAAYEFEFDVECVKVGFVTDDKQTMGCSPDRLVGEDGMIEIKSLRAKNAIKTYIECVSTQKCPKEYHLQIQGQLMITGRAWCDLVLFHPSLPLKTFRVYPDQEIHNALLTQIKAVCEHRDEIIKVMRGEA